MKCDVLILAGLWNSGPDHWQSHWQGRYPKWTKAEHRDWNCPERDEWVAELDAAIAACKGAPILVAHSLGCMLVAHWAASGSPLRVAGAFLVAPSDVEAPSYPVPVNGFAPIPLAPLPFPSLVVASTDDPYVSNERAEAFASGWGSRLVKIGDAGHINGESGHGPWPEGERLLEEFCDAIGHEQR
ncbi:RBBP9/YdeN family alpha/beta hydrolase [Massilia agri]|uniref:Alpha/beta hydrolase n=1 Tax=Massilia agri TaxID=1886785 RepID=A0ABT2AT50_9BURK|nr:alpha/beta hydrolase [Massilia agri]MCS0599419.1 alpha/beta hydrolase [Massilia agri]